MKYSQEQLRQKLEELHLKELRYQEEKRNDAEKESALFPVFFRKGGVLHPWLERARLGERSADVVAIRLLAKLREFQALAHPPEGEPALHELALVLYELSREAHRFWKKQNGDFIETAIAWRDAFNAATADLKLPLQVQAIFPKDRFDTNFMIPADVSSDHRLFVKEPLSWAVLDTTTPDHSKVLHYGQVETV